LTLRTIKKSIPQDTVTGSTPTLITVQTLHHKPVTHFE